MLSPRLAIAALALVSVSTIDATVTDLEARLVGTWEIRGDVDSTVRITYRTDHSFVIDSRDLSRRVGAGTWRIDRSDLITHIETHIFRALRGKSMRQPILALDADMLKIQDKGTVIYHRVP